MTEEFEDRPRKRRRRETAPELSLANDIENSLADDGLDRVFKNILRQNQARQGVQKIYTATGAENRMIGIPLPALSLCYTFQATVLPLSRVVQVVGAPGSCKSALLSEFMRWVLSMPGAAFYFENENKEDACVLRNSILEHREEWKSVLGIIQTHSMDEWMKEMQANAAFTIAQHEGPKAIMPGWVYPYFFGLDSLMSTPTLETLEKQRKEGVGRGYAIEANYLARFGRALPEIMGGRPFLFVATNHYKPSKDPVTGIVVRNIPGGEAFKFMESAELELSRVKDIQKADVQGVLIKIKAFKNCFGESRRSIQVPFVWRHEMLEDYTTRQWTMWDWYSATINLFETLRIKKKGLWNKLNEVVDFRVERGKVWSKALGIDKVDAVSTFEAGWALEQREDLLDQLYGLLHIFRGRFFRSGMDYQAMLAEKVAAPGRPSERHYTKPIAADELTGGDEEELEAA